MQHLEVENINKNTSSLFLVNAFCYGTLDVDAQDHFSYNLYNISCHPHPEIIGSGLLRVHCVPAVLISDFHFDVPYLG